MIIGSRCQCSSLAFACSIVRSPRFLSVVRDTPPRDRTTAPKASRRLSRGRPDSLPKLVILSRETSLVSRALDPPRHLLRVFPRRRATWSRCSPGCNISTVRISMIHAWPANDADEINTALDYAEYIYIYILDIKDENIITSKYSSSGCFFLCIINASMENIFSG